VSRKRSPARTRSGLERAGAVCCSRHCVPRLTTFVAETFERVHRRNVMHARDCPFIERTLRFGNAERPNRKLAGAPNGAPARPHLVRNQLVVGRPIGLAAPPPPLCYSTRGFVVAKRQAPSDKTLAPLRRGFFMRRNQQCGSVLSQRACWSPSRTSPRDGMAQSTGKPYSSSANFSPAPPCGAFVLGSPTQKPMRQHVVDRWACWSCSEGVGNHYHPHLLCAS
jgi:hypothetical protein